MSANIPDIPDNDPKTEKKMIQRGETPQASTDLWSLYLEEANKRAKGKADLWNGSLSAFLLFAGLFAGVVSSFVIDSRAGLQPNASANLPSKSIKVPVSTVAINFLWFTSLTFTLISALAAVLAQTWVVEFSLVPPNDFKGAMERWIHDDKAEHWQLNTAIAWITVLIQLALFLFLAGFAVQAVVDHRSLGWTILSFVGATLVLYIGITVLPLFYPATPFRTPFSQLVTDNEISHLSNPNAVKNRRRGIWEFIISTWKKLFKAPTENEVRLGICWAILQHSSNTATIHAAVLELTAKRITPDQSEQLVEFGLPHELSNRLAYLPPLTEAQTDTVERLQNYLHVIMWMVDGCGPDVAEGFSILLRQGGLLLKLNALPPSCRGVAFAIRVHLLVNIDTEEEIDGTDWTTLIDCLDQSFALDVFRAAILGLEYLTIFDDVPEKKRKMAHLRQDCARMLAAYAGSTRFSNAHLVASRMTGDPLRITRPEQETVEQIHVFFSQLEEAWKRSMCTRAIRSMEDVRIDRRIMGFSVLSSVAKDENFRDAISDVLPELGSSLNKVDWETSVECLGRLSEIYKQGSPGG
ncbi:hypothetical protein C8F04DRAFT_99518 [Mycena alexandri]|uniref:DUF6535 domain-containing protein n=1 Tax=Mycena alexandri TaxID=1745969 RepID=A0AAD6WXH6_9AGAR|nr:hypothetical protein C8F04DRAFT_99518 [Mycena alexandri]